MAYTKIGMYQTNGRNIYGSVLDTYFFGVDVYVESSDAVNNYSNVKFVPWVMMTGGGTTTSSTYYFKCSGSTYQTIYIKLGVNDTAGYATPYHANEKIIKYYHNEDGTKTITFNFSVETEVTEGANANLNNYCFKSASITQTITLPTINRLSPFSWSGDFTLGESKRITISPYVSGYTHNLTYSFGAISGTIGNSLSTSVDWTPPTSLGSQIPNSTGGVGTITCSTYNGSTLIGTSSKTFTLWVSGGMYPTFDYIMTENDTFEGLLLTTKSSVKFEITNAEGSNGSTIKSYSISGEGLSTTNASGTTSRFSNHGTFTYRLSVTDSRNRTTTKTKSVVVYNYFSPQVSFLNLSRADADGNASDVGDFLYCKINYSIANPNSANKNGKQYLLQYREEGVESWSTSLSTRDLNSYNSSDFIIKPTTTFEASKSYEIRVGIKDNFTTTYITGTIPTSTCILDIEPMGVGVGKYHQNGALDIMGDIYINGFNIKTNNDTGDLLYSGNNVAVTKSVGFTPYLFSSTQPSATWTQSEGWGLATYLGDLIFVQGRAKAMHDGSPNPLAEVSIGGLPELNKWGYPPVNFSWVSGLNTNLNNYTYAPRGYVELDAAFIRLCFDYRGTDDSGFQIFRSIYLRNDVIDVSFSAIYKWK